MTPELFGVWFSQSTFTLGSRAETGHTFLRFETQEISGSPYEVAPQNSSGIVGSLESLESEENDEICCQNYLCLEP